MLAGLAVSLTSAQGTVDYADLNDAVRASSRRALIEHQPPTWAGKSAGGMSLWAMAGYGTGEVEIADAVGADASDLAQTMFGVGASGSG